MAARASAEVPWDRSAGSSVPPAVRAFLILALLVAAPAAATDADLRSVAAMRFHERVLLVFAPSLGDPRLAEQRKALARFGPGAAARDLVLVQVSQGRVLGAHDREDKLRHKYQTPPSRYRTLLIGKDGNVALDQAGPIDEHRLSRLIDAMPMRQEEMRRAGAPKR